MGELATAVGQGWTLAYRRRRSARFKRLTDWDGTWAQARDLGDALPQHSNVDVWVVPTRQAELDGRVYPEDIQNILTDTEARVAVRETGTVRDLLLFLRDG
jgi:hypothetical protein